MIRTARLRRRQALPGAEDHSRRCRMWLSSRA